MNGAQSCPWPLLGQGSLATDPYLPQSFPSHPSSSVIQRGSSFLVPCCASRGDQTVSNFLQYCRYLYQVCFTTYPDILHPQSARRRCRLDITVRVQILAFTKFILAQQRGQLQVQIFITCTIYGNTQYSVLSGEFWSSSESIGKPCQFAISNSAAPGSTLPAGSGSKLGHSCALEGWEKNRIPFLER